MNKTVHFLLLAAMLLPGAYTFGAAPAITKFTPASGPVGTLVIITGTNLTHVSSFTIGGVSAVVVSNTATKLAGLVMPGAATGTITVTTTGGTVTSATKFTVHTTPYPESQKNDKLVATGTTGVEPNQGRSVAISADGKTAIVGAQGDNNYIGAAIIYTRTGNTWTQQGAKLVGSGAVGQAYMGQSVAISADGNTALVGGLEDNNGAGAVWVFVRKAGVWSQQGAKLVGTGTVGTSANQGISVSLSADGNTALIGGPGDSLVATSAGRGAAWIFTRSGTTWTQLGKKLVGTGNVGVTNQGWSVALSSDGATAIVGGDLDNTDIGAAWIFTKSGNTWKQQGNKLVGTGNTGQSREGSSVGISADGNTVIIGGPDDNNFVGGIWIFTRSGTTWSQQGGKMVGTVVANNPNQGFSVAISADGNTAIEGALGDITGDEQAGAAWVFKRKGQTWSQQGSKLVGTGFQGSSAQGYSVALSPNAETALVGGPQDNNGIGAVWVYYSQTSADAPQITSFLPASGSIGTLVTITGTYLLNASVLTIGGVPATALSSSATQIVALVMPGAATGPISITTGDGSYSTSDFDVTKTGYPVTQQGNKIVASGTGAAAYFATSVAISANGNTALVGAPYDNEGIGGALLFTRSGSTWTQLGLLFGGNYDQPPPPNDILEGQSVAISANATTAVIGGPGDNNGTGAIWIFTYTNGAWNEQATKLIPDDTIGTSNFGDAVAISADGNTLVAGGGGDNDATGACWVFQNTGNGWAELAKLVGTNGGPNGPLSDLGQGFSVAISADGHTIIEGSPNDGGAVGATWVFTNASGTWKQQGSKLVGTGASGGASQGSALGISADGNTVVIGGDNDESVVGACWIFTRTGTTWTQQGNKLVGTGWINSTYQGYSVAMSADGNTIVEGGPEDNSQSGAFWTFTRSGPTWTQQGGEMVGTGAATSAYQGATIAISADGNTTIEGGPFDNNQTGAVWVFVSAAQGMVMEQNQDFKDEASVTATEPFGVKAWPNPFTGDFHLLISAQSSENIDIKIYNVFGQTVYTSNLAGIENGSSDFEVQLPGSTLANGVYLVQVKQGSNSRVVRMVREE